MEEAVQASGLSHDEPVPLLDEDEEEELKESAKELLAHMSPGLPPTGHNIGCMLLVLEVRDADPSLLALPAVIKWLSVTYTFSIRTNSLPCCSVLEIYALLQGTVVEKRGAGLASNTCSTSSARKNLPKRCIAIKLKLIKL